jgi:hypothetical protein
MKKDSPILFMIILIVVLALGVAGVIYLQNSVPDTIKSGVSKDNSVKAVVRCEEVVKASLRNAVKAKFSNQKTTPLGKERYQITGKIEAPNASGIIARGNYNCIFNFNTKSFDLLSLEGDDIWTPLKK